MGNNPSSIMYGTGLENYNHRKSHTKLYAYAPE
jgi:hypothetical protein